MANNVSICRNYFCWQPQSGVANTFSILIHFESLLSTLCRRFYLPVVELLRSCLRDDLAMGLEVFVNYFLNFDTSF